MAVQRICDPMLPELSRVFDAPLNQAAQVVSTFAIVYGLMQLFYGPVGDRWGKYRVVVLAALGCSVGCLACALSKDLAWLVAARVSTALCAAAIIPLSLAWVGDAVRYEYRQETLARVGLGTMLGITAGQLFGGLLTDTLGWRWAFALMAVLFCWVSAMLKQHAHKLPATQEQPHVPAGFFTQLRLGGHDNGLVWGGRHGLHGQCEGGDSPPGRSRSGAPWRSSLLLGFFADRLDPTVAACNSSVFCRRLCFCHVSQHHASQGHPNGAHGTRHGGDLVCWIFIFRTIAGCFGFGAAHGEFAVFTRDGC